MLKRIIECVPNFSVGCDIEITDKIAKAIKEFKLVKLLHIDSNRSANRTVMTFAGKPEDVVEAAYKAISKAIECIDMRIHKGEHPRIGAVDVVPLVPIVGITNEETVKLAHSLAMRIATNHNLPIFCYGYAAQHAERNRLEQLRSGEYEGLAEKLKSEIWKPDFGPSIFVPKSGATAIGVRDYLIAFNVNLNSQSEKIANAIAGEIRESGKVQRNENLVEGKIIDNENNKLIRIPGKLKSVKALGWYIEEFNCAQVSMNITNMNITPMHIAFEEASKSAENYGVKVTGSEIVGLVPLKAMLDAGYYFAIKNKLTNISKPNDLINCAIDYLGLNSLYKFKPEEKILEYQIKAFLGK